MKINMILQAVGLILLLSGGAIWFVVRLTETIIALIKAKAWIAVYFLVSFILIIIGLLLHSFNI